MEWKIHILITVDPHSMVRNGTRGPQLTDWAVHLGIELRHSSDESARPCAWLSFPFTVFFPWQIYFNHSSNMFISWTSTMSILILLWLMIWFLNKKIPLLRVFVPCIILCGKCLKWDYWSICCIIYPLAVYQWQQVSHIILLGKLELPSLSS